MLQDTPPAAKTSASVGGLASLRRYFPILEWSRTYSRLALSRDLVAAVIVTVMLIPQSLAYALLAGLPPVVGLYASLLPLLAYAVFGTSRVLSVGPVAVISLMTAAAAGGVATAGSPEYLAAAIALAMISGLMLLAMGIFRLGFLANLLSHPVVSGFISASGILIAASQLKHILGVKAEGEDLYAIGSTLLRHAGDANPYTLGVGLGTILFLVWARSSLKLFLVRRGIRRQAAGLMAKAAPAVAILLTTIVVAAADLPAKGVKTVGDIPVGLPHLAFPQWDPVLWSKLLVGSLFIAIIGFVESISVAQTLAAKRRRRIDPDQELVALGSANVLSSMSGGFPVTGGFSRSVVNYDAGAETPASGAYTAIGMALASILLTPFLFYLPLATLAATIIVAVLSLVDLDKPRELWRYSKRDFAGIAATIAITLADGVETGVLAGVAISLALLVWHASRPHAAVVGRIPHSEHFRNVRRHEVLVAPHLLTIRIDESLTYLNSRWFEDFVFDQVAKNPEVRELVLMCSAVNWVDATGLEMLEALNRRLADSGVILHLSEVKGPVMDRLARSNLLDELRGKIFLSQNEAFEKLAPAAASEGHLSKPDIVTGGAK
ncbi:SulP family inorganic anion transporter [Qipengyuania sp. RANM35]|uniref:SulP family inorganic anion transporter n=1 Tax=Qipengyuania sp. RANM35 TaxID=3068635 RepID=UPI0034DABF58